MGTAPTPDQALAAARTITRLVRGFPSLRSTIPLASWRQEPSARWKVRSSERCLAQAAALKLPTHPLTRELTTPVPAPVVITGPVGGVLFRPVQKDRELELSCELATRLPALAKILRAHGVRAVHVNSSYRDQPRVSFHTFGLALDMASFETKDGPLSVATDFEITPDVETCSGKPTTARGQALLSLACDLSASGLFSSVLTPNYNEGHRDHFHLDVRPDDARLYVR
ncbi:MAG: extensin family protein [Polyangiales bacterium]